MHIRKSHHSVRPEYYQCIDSLVSKYHCTYSQGEAAVVVVGRTMFGRSWKFFDEDKDVITLDTVPHHKNQIIHSRAAEAFTIDKIVRSIMESDETSSITYHDDGSKTQVNIFRKTRTNLKLLYLRALGRSQCRVLPSRAPTTLSQPYKSHLRLAVTLLS